MKNTYEEHHSENYPENHTENHPKNNPAVFSKELAKATGPIDYGFTNDYMFRAILQKNQRC
jgi:hypothetical protein